MKRSRDTPHPSTEPAACAEVDVVVLGAGPAGLAAADELLAHGLSVLVVELADEPGGLCRSFERRGFFFDQGGHRFITRNRQLFDRIRELLGDRLRVRERHSVIRIEGREYRYPLDFAEVLKGEGVGGVARILASYLISRFRDAFRQRAGAGPDSLESWVRRHFGGAIYVRFFRDYTRKLWGLEGSEISGDWAGRRISQLDLRDFARHVFGKKAPVPRTFAARYSYPRHGIGEIFGTLARRIQEAGGVLSTSSRAIGLPTEGPLAVELATPAGQREVRCEHIISTIPLPDLVDLLGAPDDIRRSARRLRFRGLRFLNLLLEGPPLSDRTWMYVPEKRFMMTRVQFPGNRSPENCPPGMTSVQLEIPCDPGNAIWEVSDSELLERCLPQLAELGFDVGARLLDGFSTRARHAYPIYTLDYRSSLDLVLAWIHRQPRIQTCGRQGQFSYIFFDRAMESGLRAASRITGVPAIDETASEDPLLPEEADSIVGEPTR